MNAFKLSIVAMIALLAPAAVAPAAQVAPPDNSAINQYKETLPAPGGGRPTDSTDERSPQKVLGTENADQLEQLGPDGEAAAEAAAETAPEAAKAKGSGGTAKGGSDESTSSAFEEIAGQATGAEASGGIGWLLPLVIVLAAAGAAAYAIARRRTQG